tara:strand:+ start:324 stop:1013 length:690 start_codon:yes stop_codon:yes gene_type:complete
MISKELQNFIKDNVLKNNNKCKYLETGFLEGQSAHEMLLLGFEKVVSIEIDNNFIKLGKQKFNSFIKSDRLEIVQGDSAEKIEQYYSDEFDVTFLDAHGTSDKNLIEKSAPLEQEINSIINKGLKDHQILIIDDYLKIKYFFLFSYNNFDWRFLANRKKIDNLINQLNQKVYEVPYKGNCYLLVVGNNYTYKKKIFKNLFYKIYNIDFILKYSYYLLKRIIKYYYKKFI